MKSIHTCNERGRGFSLVELLLVLAIIGILASITMGSLSGVRRNARDKSIQTSMQGVLIEASLFKAKHSGSYSGFCADSAYTTLRDKINNDNGSSYGAPDCQVSASNTAFGVVVRLNAGTYYCVDSSKYFGVDANGTLNAGTKLCS